MIKANLSVNRELCKGCLLCTIACPQKILMVDTQVINAKGYHTIQCIAQKLCTACSVCAVVCPDGAIKIEAERA